jgi:hypothetical protein
VAYTKDHLLVTVQGTAWAGSETWQFGVRAELAAGYVPVPGVPGELQTMADALAAPTEAFLTSNLIRMTSNARLTAIKVAYVQANGHYPPDGVPGIYSYGVPGIPGTGVGSVVPQATIACTLLTTKPRGRSSRGRFYLPPQIQPLQADGRLLEGTCNEIESECKTWLNAIRGTAQATEILVMSKLGTGTTSTVNAVGVGRVVDTMRSRRRALKEDRTPLAL